MFPPGVSRILGGVGRGRSRVERRGVQHTGGVWYTLYTIQHTLHLEDATENKQYKTRVYLLFTIQAILFYYVFFLVLNSNENMQNKIHIFSQRGIHRPHVSTGPHQTLPVNSNKVSIIKSCSQICKKKIT